MTRRTLYRVAGASLLVETRDRAAAAAVDALFAGWYLTPDAGTGARASEGASDGASGGERGDDGGDDGAGGADGLVPAIVLHSEVAPPAIPSGLPAFDVAGGGLCYTDARASYLEIEGSLVAIGAAPQADVEVWMNGPLPLDAPALTRIVTYALAAALRLRQRFQLHSGALIDPETGKGLLIVGPSGSGKSTLTVHLASAGWPFLTDDVLLLGREGAAAPVTAWPLRRCFAITAETFAASGFLQARTRLDHMETQADDKQQFLPHEVFATGDAPGTATAGFADRCEPGVLLFPELTGAAESEISRLSAGDTMARLIRLNPWACYDRATAPQHLAMLSALVKQCAGFTLRAGRDLLQPETAVSLVSARTRDAAVLAR